MKTIKLIIAAVLVMAGMSVMGQTTDFFHNGTNLYYTGGNVGVGTTTPVSALDVSRFMTEPSIIIHNTGSNGGATFQMIDDLNSGNWKFKSIFGGGFKIRDQASGLDVFTIEKATMANAIFVKAGGNVGIGTNNPTSALTVNGDVTADNIVAADISANGKITTKEVEVTLTGWPDYVFDEEYQLTPLSEVEKFVKENGHLPGIKSAKEIEENGLSLGEMNKNLMEKVEELTLYIIQLQKEVDALKL